MSFTAPLEPTPPASLWPPAGPDGGPAAPKLDGLDRDPAAPKLDGPDRDPAALKLDGQDGDPARLAGLALLDLAADEAVLPAGIRLVDETRPGRRCFLLLEGSATVEAAGTRLSQLHAGAFIGSADPSGRPLPPSGLTVRLATRSRVLVIDAGRLAVLIDSDPVTAAAWRRLRPATTSR